MINRFVKFFSGRDIILIDPHRNSKPIIEDKYNQSKYIFIDPKWIVKSTAIFGRRSKIRYRLMGMLLTVIDPLYIIGINWILRLETLYYVWCRNHGKKFIVIQHGTHDAGEIIDEDHRIVKCQTFLVWSEYFKQIAKEDNPNRNFECIVFGNPVFNQYDRDQFSYKNGFGKKILVAVSVIWNKRLETLNRFLEKLEKMGFDVTLKEHAMQNSMAEAIPFKKKIGGYLYPMLIEKHFDLVVTDISTVMNDVIFFKNKAIFFSPEGEKKVYTENIYAKYLRNIASNIDDLNAPDDVYDFVDLASQEKLLRYMVDFENKSNRLDILS